MEMTLINSYEYKITNFIWFSHPNPFIHTRRLLVGLRILLGDFGWRNVGVWRGLQTQQADLPPGRMFAETRGKYALWFSKGCLQLHRPFRHSHDHGSEILNPVFCMRDNKIRNFLKNLDPHFWNLILKRRTKNLGEISLISIADKYFKKIFNI